MTSHEHRAGVVNGLTKQQISLYEGSSQAMYIFLDNVNKSCNRRFSDMLGYASPETWAAVAESFPTAFVEEASQDALTGAYQAAMTSGTGASFRVKWKRKDGRSVASNVILVPIEFDGHRMALHFIQPA